VTSRYLNPPDVQAMLDAGAAFSGWWSPTGPQSTGLTLIDPAPGVREQGLVTAVLCGWSLVGLTGFEPATP
jgi:hypothetical protein